MTTATSIETETDADLLAAWESGDERAFTRLVERHGRLVLAACRRLAPSGEAEDCAQAAFLILARRPAAARRSPALAGWLLRTTWHVCRRAERSRIRRRRAEASWQPPAPPSPPDPAVAALEACLTRLPERQRAAVLRHHLEGRSAEEIGRDLGLSANAARQLIHRGVVRLRRLAGPPSAGEAALGAIALDAAGAVPIAFSPAVPSTHPAAVLAAAALRDIAMPKIVLSLVLLLCALGAGAWLAAGEGGGHPYEDLLREPVVGGYAATTLAGVLESSPPALPVLLEDPALGRMPVEMTTAWTTRGQWWAAMAAALGLEARMTKDGLLLARPRAATAGVPLADELDRLGIPGIPANAFATRLDLVAGGVRIDAIDGDAASATRWLIDARTGRAARYRGDALVAAWTCTVHRIGELLVLAPDSPAADPASGARPDAFALHPDAFRRGWLIGDADAAHWQQRQSRHVILPAETDAGAQLDALRAGAPLARWSSGGPPRPAQGGSATEAAPAETRGAF